MKTLLAIVGLVASTFVSLPVAEAATSAGQVVSPTPGSTLTSSTATFQWTAGAGVTRSRLLVGTAGPGSGDLYNQFHTNLSATVTGLPTNGVRIYVRLWSDSLWHDVSYLAHAAVAGVPATMTTPAPSSTLTASTVTFQWTGGTSVLEYWLSIGTTAGDDDLYNQSHGTNLSATVPGLPADGRTLYVRLWSLIGADYQYRDYTYTATTNSTPVPAQMVGPAPGSTLVADAVQFRWTGGSGVSEYWLSVGAVAGGEEIYSASQGTNLSKTVQNLPHNGSTVHVTLWSLINGAWTSIRYSYTATTSTGGGGTGTAAQMLSPAPGSTLTASTVQFQWNGGTGTTGYWLSAGATVGGLEYHNMDHGTNLSATVTGLPTNGGTVYVRLWSVVNGVWRSNDYTYTAATPGGGATLAEMTSPAPGSTLSGSTVQFQWTGGTGVTGYWLYVGTTEGGNQLYDQNRGTNLSATVAGLPTNGSTVYVRLWSLANGAWLYRSYTYTAATVASARAQMTAPAPGSTLTSSTTQFQWSGGTGVSQYWLTIGATAAGEEIHSASHGTSLSATVTGLPTNGSTLYVRLWSLISGAWQVNNYTYTASTPGAGATPAELTTPAPGSTLSASTVQFQWTGGTNVTQYWLFVGTTAGGSQIFNQDRGSSLTATVTGLPTNGSTVYVQLWSLANGAWVSRDYTLTASTSGGTSSTSQMTAPTPGSTLSSSSVQFQWTSVTGATQYWLTIGAAPGGEEIYSADRGTNLTATVTGLPTNGNPLYVGLWWVKDGVWKKNDYVYTAAQ